MRNLSEATPPGDIPGGQAAKIVAFHGGKGGVGTTMMAAEVAAVMAGSGRSVVAVDLDLYRGDLHYRFDVPVSGNTYTLSDLLPLLDDLDAHILDNALSRSASLARLLPAPTDPREANVVDSSATGRLLLMLAASFDLVIIDTASRLDPVTRSVLMEADRVVLVLVPELTCVGDTRRLLDSLTDEERASGRIKLVANRSLGERDHVTVGQMESFLEMPVSLVLPEEAVLCRTVTDEGRMLSGEPSALGRGLMALAGQLFPSIKGRTSWIP